MRFLSRKGVLGINARNLHYIMRFNPRTGYPAADNKLITKRLASERGVAVPPLYGVIRYFRDVRELPALLENRRDFVLKPVHGSGGDGVVVIVDRADDNFRTARGTVLSLHDLQQHTKRTLNGLYSLGGQPDMLMIEYRVKVDPVFEAITYSGVPDVRVITFMGVPVMAMLRLPTAQSGGRANLHQGAIGVGVNLATGSTLSGVSGSSIIHHHPDTKNPICKVSIPRWQEILTVAAGFHTFIGLGYIGVDIVLDRECGPMVLEVNARPGLAIQLANRAGLKARLDVVERHLKELEALSVDEKVKFGTEHFGIGT